MLVAGTGWAGGTIPSALSGSGSGSAEPTVWLMLASALGLGIALGAVLGWAQSVLLGYRVRHPRRWIAASACAWPPAMVIIFAGATTPDQNWPAVAVLALALVVGVLAGAALGFVLGWFAPTLNGTSAVRGFSAAG
jgi:hypothetical protein